MIKVRIALWGKGFRVSETHEEFQRLLPRDSRDLAGGESELDQYRSWPRFMSSAHVQENASLQTERALIVRKDDAVAIQLFSTRDRHRRPSVCVLAATFTVDWADPLLGRTIDAVQGWLSELAQDYAGIIGENQERVGKQLRDGSFVASREFDVSLESSDKAVDWISVVRAVREWRGVVGVGTTFLGSLGANVLLAPADVKPSWHCDGRIDPASGDLLPLTDRLERWQPKARDVGGASTATADTLPVAPSVAKELDRMNGRIERLVGMVEEVLRALGGRH